VDNSLDKGARNGRYKNVLRLPKKAIVAEWRPVCSIRGRSLRSLRLLPHSGEDEGDRGGLLFLDRSWTTDERTVPKVKSQEAVRIPRNADPNTPPDFAGRVVAVSEP
jgi:hypothetical protein